MSNYKLLKCAISDEQLIEQYETELYESNLSERELVTMALEVYFSEESRMKV